MKLVSSWRVVALVLKRHSTPNRVTNRPCHLMEKQLTNPPQCRLCNQIGHRTRDCPDQSEGEEGFVRVSAAHLERLEEHKLREEDPRLVARKQAPQNMEVNTEASKSLEEPRLGARRRSLRGAASDPVTVPLTPGRETPAELSLVAVEGLTAEEMAMIGKRREKLAKSKAKRQETAALTGSQADYPSLGNAWSSDLVTNIMRSVESRLLALQWKKMVWQLRVKLAVEKEGHGKLRWKRNPRWISLMIGTEVAALWGHFGAMRQKLRAPDVVQRC